MENEYFVDQTLANIDFSQYEVVAISAYSTKYKYLKEFTIKLKDKYPDTRIWCGGPGPTFSDQIILKITGVDVCILGERELTFLELLENHNGYYDVAGISYLLERRYCRTNEREPIKNLDEIPFPNRELFDFEHIIEGFRKISFAADQAKKLTFPFAQAM